MAAKCIVRVPSEGYLMELTSAVAKWLAFHNSLSPLDFGPSISRAGFVALPRAACDRFACGISVAELILRLQKFSDKGTRHIEKTISGEHLRADKLGLRVSGGASNVIRLQNWTMLTEPLEQLGVFLDADTKARIVAGSMEAVADVVTRLYLLYGQDMEATAGLHTGKKTALPPLSNSSSFFSGPDTAVEDLIGEFDPALSSSDAVLSGSEVVVADVGTSLGWMGEIAGLLADNLEIPDARAWDLVAEEAPNVLLSKIVIGGYPVGNFDGVLLWLGAIEAGAAGIAHTLAGEDGWGSGVGESSKSVTQLLGMLAHGLRSVSPVVRAATCAALAAVGMRLTELGLGPECNTWFIGPQGAVLHIQDIAEDCRDIRLVAVLLEAFCPHAGEFREVLTCRLRNGFGADVAAHLDLVRSILEDMANRGAQHRALRSSKTMSELLSLAVVNMGSGSGERARMAASGLAAVVWSSFGAYAEKEPGKCRLIIALLHKGCHDRSLMLQRTSHHALICIADALLRNQSDHAALAYKEVLQSFANNHAVEELHAGISQWLLMSLDAAYCLRVSPLADMLENHLALRGCFVADLALLEAVARHPTLESQQALQLASICSSSILKEGPPPTPLIGSHHLAPASPRQVADLLSSFLRRCERPAVSSGMVDRFCAKALQGIFSALSSSSGGAMDLQTKLSMLAMVDGMSDASAVSSPHSILNVRSGAGASEWTPRQSIRGFDVGNAKAGPDAITSGGGVVSVDGEGLIYALTVAGRDAGPRVADRVVAAVKEAQAELWKLGSGPGGGSEGFESGSGPGETWPRVLNALLEVAAAGQRKGRGAGLNRKKQLRNSVRELMQVTSTAFSADSLSEEEGRARREGDGSGFVERSSRNGRQRMYREERRRGRCGDKGPSSSVTQPEKVAFAFDVDCSDSGSSWGEEEDAGVVAGERMAGIREQEQRRKLEKDLREKRAKEIEGIQRKRMEKLAHEQELLAAQSAREARILRSLRRQRKSGKALLTTAAGEDTLEGRGGHSPTSSAVAKKMGDEDDEDEVLERNVMDGGSCDEEVEQVIEEVMQELILSATEDEDAQPPLLAPVWGPGGGASSAADLSTTCGGGGLLSSDDRTDGGRSSGLSPGNFSSQGEWGVRGGGWAGKAPSSPWGKGEDLGLKSLVSGEECAEEAPHTTVVAGNQGSSGDAVVMNRVVLRRGVGNGTAAASSVVGSGDTDVGGSASGASGRGWGKGGPLLGSSPKRRKGGRKGEGSESESGGGGKSLGERSGEGAQFKMRAASLALQERRERLREAEKEAQLRMEAEERERERRFAARSAKTRAVAEKFRAIRQAQEAARVEEERVAREAEERAAREARERDTKWREAQRVRLNEYRQRQEELEKQRKDVERHRLQQEEKRRMALKGYLQKKHQHEQQQQRLNKVERQYSHKAGVGHGVKKHARGGGGHRCIISRKRRQMLAHWCC